MNGRTIGLLATFACITIFPGNTRVDPGQEMADAASGFLATLSNKERATCQMPFDDSNRKTWHYVPGNRKGIRFGDMNSAQKRAAQGLLRSALSTSGYLKATGIMDLERVLGKIGNSSDRYSPAFYWLAIFGDPASESPWGWRLEGHHLSLNFSSASRSLTAVTPWFMGAQPSEFQQGIREGLKILGKEEGLARNIMSSLRPDQMKQTLIDDEAPRDIIMGPARKKWIDKPVGLSSVDMDAKQRNLLHMLIGEFAGNLRPDLATGQLARMLGTDQPIHFAWAGSLRERRGHYFRIQGAKFIIEYDNVQQNANHAHTVWRDRERDFGEDILLKHHRDGHNK